MRLEYASREQAPERLTLLVDEEQCALIFRLSSAWLPILAASAGFASAAMHLGFCVWMMAKFEAAFVAALWQAWSTWLFGALVWGGIGLHGLRRYRRYGGKPQRLCFNKLMGTLRFEPERSGRFREWPMRAIREVRFGPLRSIIPGISVSELKIRIGGKLFPIRKRFRGDDVAIAEQFAEELKLASNQLTGVALPLGPTRWWWPGARSIGSRR